MANITIPKEFAQVEKLVAIPREAYLEWRRTAPKGASPVGKVFRPRSLEVVARELRTTHPDRPQLVDEVVRGLAKSSLYAKRSAAAR
jgi:hypothetical protein